MVSVVGLATVVAGEVWDGEVGAWLVGAWWADPYFARIDSYPLYFGDTSSSRELEVPLVSSFLSSRTLPKREGVGCSSI